MSVYGPNRDGHYEGKVGGNEVTYGKVKEPPATWFGDQHSYYSQGYWWLKTAEKRGKVIILRREPREGQVVDYDDKDEVIVILNEEAIRY